MDIINNDIKAQTEQFFAGYPQQLALFKAIDRMISGLGPVKLEVKKTQISWGTKYKFAWVWLPLKFGSEPHGHVRRIGSLVLSFGLDHLVGHPRIVQTANPYPGRWTHHVIISREDEIDEIIKECLEDAYRFSHRP